jgi:predicted esterase
MTFEELDERVLTLYAEGRYAEALDLLERERTAVAGHPAVAAFYVACLHCVDGSPNIALDTLERGLAAGLWWSPVTLGRESDLAPLRGRAEFGALLRESDRRMRAARVTEPVMRISRPERPSGTLLVVLHGAWSTAADVAPYWEEAAGAGVTVAVPQSPYPVTSDGGRFSWPEPGVQEEVSDALSRVKASEAFDPDRVILAGFSQGGRLAVDMGARGEPFPVDGVITVGAGLLPEENPLVPGPGRVAPPFWFLTGEHDHGRESVERFHATLTDRGYRSRLDVVAGLGHSFPDDFAQRLPGALEWVLGGST